MSSWNPDPSTVEQLAEVLTRSSSDSEAVRVQATQALEEAKLNPDLSKYLVYLLATNINGVNSATRAIAGIWLKNNINSDWPHVPIEVVDYIKEKVVIGLTGDDQLVRNISGIVLTTLYSKIGISQWPNVLDQLLEMMESNVTQTQESAISALSKICEDCTEMLDQDMYGGGSGTNGMVWEAQELERRIIPRLLDYFSSETPRVRSNSLFCISQFISLQSQHFLGHIDVFLQSVFTLANDPYPDTRRNVASAFNSLLEVRPDKLLPHLEGIVSFCLHCMKDTDDQVALEGAEFILSLAEMDNNFVQPLLPSIIPVLLTTMVYSEMDLLLLENLEEDDEDVVDKAEDIRPVNAKSKEGHHVKTKTNDKPGNNDDDDEDDFDDDAEDSLDDWNLRKCSAAALDAFSMKFAPTVMDVARPLLQERINDSEWPVRESAVLAFGAVAHGCLIFDKVDFVPDLIPFLVRLLTDEKAQIREISCWTLGRYSERLVGIDEVLAVTFQGLMGCCLDKNKKVQLAGCNAISVTADHASEKLVPFTEPLLYHFQKCFQKYQQKNMYALYECIQSSVTAVSFAINNPDYIHLLMEPMVHRWQSHRDADRELLPLLDCLSTVAAFAGESFGPYAPTVFERCVNIIKQNLVRDESRALDPLYDEDLEKEFLSCSLDLIDGLVQGLYDKIKPLFDTFQDPPVMDMVLMCMNVDVPEVRQSAFGLVGDMAIYIFPEIQPRVDDILRSLILNIDGTDPNLSGVRNNAMWAIGEISLNIGTGIEPYFNDVFPRLGQVLVNETVPTLIENAAIAIGRIGLSLPNLIAPHLSSIIEHWLTVMSDVDETNEKDTAFQGMCLTICSNPTALNESQLLLLFASFGSYFEPSAELRKNVANVLSGYKSLLGNLDGLFDQLGQNLKTQILTTYG